MSTLAINTAGELTTIPDIPNLRVLEPVGGILTQAFGVRSVTGILHRGRDKSVPALTEIRAAQSGMVTFTYAQGRDMPGLEPDGSPGGYGNQVRIAHGYSIESRYAHLAAVYLQPGVQVKAGQIIGLVGSTGISTGPHLHWELRQDGTPFDPGKYIVETLPPEEEELDPEDRAALDWLRANRGALATYAIAATKAEFDAAHDTPAPNDAVSKGIRRLTRLLRKLTGPVVEPAVETDDRLVRALSRED